MQLGEHPSLRATTGFFPDNTGHSYLGAGHPDLRPRVDVHTTVGLPGDGAAHSVGDAHSQRPSVLTVPQCQESVCSLTYNTRVTVSEHAHANAGTGLASTLFSPPPLLLIHPYSSYLKIQSLVKLWKRKHGFKHLSCHFLD